MKKLLLIMIVLSLFVQSGRAEISAVQVNDSIDRGVKFLRGLQKSDGSFPQFTAPAGIALFPDGVTSLATLALLNCGSDSTDPTVSRALSYLRSAPMSKHTYVVSLQLMVFCQAEPERDRLLIRRNAEWLIQAQKTSSGGWGYGATLPSTDPSNSQFALLALHEAERQGIAVPKQTWQTANAYWSNRQSGTGGWSYDSSFGPTPTVSMTCAGIASLVITRGKQVDLQGHLVDGEIQCCGNVTTNDQIEKGLKWLSRHIRVGSNTFTKDDSYFYYLYCIERVGRLTGKRYLGTTDWYRTGCEFIVRLQDTLRGSWTGSLAHGEHQPAVATSFALLFLSKGRRPVVISKLKYGQAGDTRWNQHPHDLQNIVLHTEQRWNMYLTWQAIDVDLASSSDLLETPVLFISGKGSLDLSARQKQNLVEYVNQGGFLFVENSCNEPQFDMNFRELIKELFPASPLAPLPPHHAIWFADSRIQPNMIGKLHGVQTCCRTSIVYSTIELGCYWELFNPRGDDTTPADIAEQISQRLAVGTNILTYATGRQLRDKLDKPSLAALDSNTTSVIRRTLTIPEISHSGGTEDAPRALDNLLAVLGSQLDVRVTTGRRVLALTDSLQPYPLVFIHGRNRFQFTAAERQALRKFVENGGVLFGDAICASRAFTESFRREMSLIFPASPLRRLPAEHVLFTAEYGGFDTTRITLRTPVQRDATQTAGIRESQVIPHVEAVHLDGRLAVAFSPYDLSCALENQVSLECKGYTRQDAARLGANIILYSLQQ
ncbi:MAG: DUF4159 domain-containing protein [Planctomycetota bacterium]|nr:DUF4159 domain-containing protein [Planctomycetota bacterium]